MSYVRGLPRLLYLFWLLLACTTEAGESRTDYLKAQQAAFIEQLFKENLEENKALVDQNIYMNDEDTVWQNDPREWYKQVARSIDYRFSTFNELESTAKAAKAAGVHVLMLVKIQQTDRCPGWWRGGFQLCQHINGEFPAADGTLQQWRKLVQDLKPMRLMWWANMGYWSVQGPVWAEAQADQDNVNKWFSWSAHDEDQCHGVNPSTAQGSFASDGDHGFQSALASWGSESYVDYLVDAMSNSWTDNLGIDGYCIDCMTCYDRGVKNCTNGMLQTKDGDALSAWKTIAKKVRERQPQVVYGAELYDAWSQVIKSDSDLMSPRGQVPIDFHAKMRDAVEKKDASDLEDVVSTSGADGAPVLCYLNPYYDGKQPGGCPSVYHSDTAPTMTDVRKHRLWVSLEAGSGVVPQHDSSGQGWSTATMDPTDSTESPLWAFTKYRPLNRLALRTKLKVSGSPGALAYLKHDSMGPFGDACIMVWNPGSAGKVTIDLSSLPETLFGGEDPQQAVVPYDLLAGYFERQISRGFGSDIPRLAKSWTVDMGEGDVKFFAGFTLGVFAPRKGKKSNCKADDSHTKKASGTTLQACFLECLRDEKCANIFVDYVDIFHTEKPPDVSCTLLGVINNPADSCENGQGTLIKRLPGARSCSYLWSSSGLGEHLPLAFNALPIFPGQGSSKCPWDPKRSTWLGLIFIGVVLALLTWGIIVLRMMKQSRRVSAPWIASSPSAAVELVSH